MDEGLSTRSRRRCSSSSTARAHLQATSGSSTGTRSSQTRDLGSRGRRSRSDGTLVERRSRKAVRAKALAKVLDPNDGHLYHFRYPLTRSGRKATSSSPRRVPRRCWATLALPCIPEDERYQRARRRKIVLPLVGREIPIVADEYSDPEKGTGAVKITPAHDFNDFEVGQRHDLEKINVLDASAS